MKDNEYSKMQKGFYDEKVARYKDEWIEIIAKSVWDKGEGNYHPVGDIKGLNAFFKDCDFLFSRLKNSQEKIALDFGCGLGRNIALYSDIFKRIDGVDISDKNINLCRAIAKSRNYNSVFYNCNGYDLSDIEDEIYDVIMSFITLQHISVHEIRLSYLKEFNRVLKPGALLEIQMGFGASKTANPVSYYENCYEAASTNGFWDVVIDDPDLILKDLKKPGFKDLEYRIVTPAGFSNIDDQFIFVTGVKK